MSHILYISYTGVLQPLGQSQVLSYLEPITGKYEVTLISYERHEDLEDEESISLMQTRMEAAGINWERLRYHKRPGGIATFWDIGCGLVKALAVTRRKAVDIVHCRSYVPSVIGICLKRFSGCKYLFDIRGFWVDERVDGGLWKKGGIAYKVGKWFEKKFFLAADAVVSLTYAGIREIEKFDYLQGRVPSCYMIPTCADLKRFTQLSGEESLKPLTIGYLGATGTWYQFEETVRCFSLLRKMKPEVKFLILNRHEHQQIKIHLKREGIPDDCVELTSARFEDVPAMISRMDATIFFIKPLYSKTASAPTKLGEFLACGKPCLVNAGVGDMEAIVLERRTGVCVRGFDDASLSDGLRELLALIDDPQTFHRCRQTAEEFFSLEQGVKSYRDIYQSLVKTR